jgi:predicted SprT family Zn-dependent metalloprotease
MPTSARLDPTRTQFSAYAGAFDYFNEQLFDGELPPCMLNFSRKARMAGFFAPQRWRNGGDHTHEISLNPDVLDLPPIEIFQTLVHEMVHLWQQELGRPSRGGYHNNQWAWKMRSIGLMPSSTGKPGGRPTGQKMADYVLPGGAFEVAFMMMPDAYVLPWISGESRGGKGGDDEAEAAEEPKSRNKIKYTCPKCKTNVWGRPELRIHCLACFEDFKEEE